MIPAFVTMAIYYGQSIQRHDPLQWQRFTAIAIFLIAAVSDGLDGYIARHYKQRSALGLTLSFLMLRCRKPMVAKSRRGLNPIRHCNEHRWSF